MKAQEETTTGRACWKCGKQIKGQTILTNPSMVEIRLGIDFPKAYHPRCYTADRQDIEQQFQALPR